MLILRSFLRKLFLEPNSAEKKHESNECGRRMLRQAVAIVSITKIFFCLHALQ